MFDPKCWCLKNVISSPMKGWMYLLVSPGDVRGELNVGFSGQLQKRIAVESIKGKPWTVVRLRESQVADKFRRCKGSYGLRNSLHQIFSNKDGRRFFADVWEKADETIKQRQKVRKIQEYIHSKRSIKKDTCSEFHQRRTIRGAAGMSL